MNNIEKQTQALEDQDFLQKLKNLCLAYDKKAGAYPESPYEGFSLYFFATHPDCDCGQDFPIIPEWVEGGTEYLEEMRKKIDD